MMKKIGKMYVIAVVISVLACCFSMLPGMAQAQQRNIILSTTTSTQDSGLLDKLIPIFEKRLDIL